MSVPIAYQGLVRVVSDRRAVMTTVVLAWALGLLVIYSQPAHGQVEMILRVEAASDVDRDLDSAAKTTAGDRQGILSGADAIRSVFPTDVRPRKTGLEPIRAYILQYPDSASLNTALVLWEEIPGVRYVQMNRIYTVDLHDSFADPLADSLDHLEVVAVPGAWSVTSGSPAITVGLVDTGIRFDHPDLLGQFAIREGEDLNRNGRLDEGDINGLDDDGNGYVDDVAGFDFVDRPQTVEPGDYRDADPFADDDGSGHGTNVAGIVAAARDNGVGITGIAPGIRLVSLRAFGRDGRGDDEDIAQAVMYAAENNISVLNLSFGDTHISPLMHEAIRYAVESGVVVVASAGNVGGDRPHYPSDYPEVISVAWLSGDGLGLASRATSGVGVDIGAPGTAIFTTTIPSDTDETGEGLYGRRSGSSMAAPMVTATAALLRSVNPSLSPASVRSALTSGATDIADTGWDHETGAGLLNAGSALLRALPARVELTSPVDDQGFASGPIEIRGSAVDPSFVSYQLFFAVGDEDLSGQSWTPIGDEQYRQTYKSVLGSWDVGSLKDGVYTLRLSVALRTGRTIEERRRVYLDRTEPAIVVHLLDESFVGGYHGVIADVETDDLTDASMTVSIAGVGRSVASPRRVRRHGLFWSDRELRGGEAVVTLSVRNVAGLRTDSVFTLSVPPYRVDTGIVTLSDPVGPEGFLLDAITDFDGDGLREVVLNVYEEGWIGDTLAVLEWDGTSLRRASSVVAGVIPRATGDSDGDGLQEVLTQIGSATFLLEQSPGAYLDRITFADTSGIAGDQQASFWGAALSDLDQDGRGEIVGHNTRDWRILEWNGASYEEVARLQNPTSVSNSELGENTYEQPFVMIGDLDGDVAPDMLVGDSDGDWIIYEAKGDNTLESVWSFETERYDAGSRFSVGDLDGDGDNEFVVYEHNWLTTTQDGEREPDIGRYTVFQNVGDDLYEPVQSFLVSGEISRHGSISMFDVNGDLADDLVVVNPPDLYVITFDSALNRELAYYAGLDAPPGLQGFRSIRTARGDIDSDGDEDLVVVDGQGALRILTSSGSIRPTPAWQAAYAIDDQVVRLSWRGYGADSVTVYRATPGAPFELLSIVSEDVFQDSVAVRSEYALQGWFGGQTGPLSRPRIVRPHKPAEVSVLNRSSRTRIEVFFTEALDSKTSPDQFSLDDGGHASGLLLGSGGRSLVLEFPDASPHADTLRWEGVADAEGTPVQGGAAYVGPADAEVRSLIIESWRIESPSRLRLTFSSPVTAESAQVTSNYRLEPAGAVTDVSFDPGTPTDVVLQLSGVVVGATGLENSLTVISVMATDGSTLAPEGNTVSLVGAARDLSDVYLFPNPYRAAVGTRGIMVAGLPQAASIEVFSADGSLIRRLEEADGDGGVLWDARDAAGSAVPSGVYLVVVKADGLGSVLKKAAIIQ